MILHKNIILIKNSIRLLCLKIYSDCVHMFERKICYRNDVCECKILSEGKDLNPSPSTTSLVAHTGAD